mgnify:CR=1 FL=1
MRVSTIEDILVSLHRGPWFGFGGKEKTYANLIIHTDDEKNTSLVSKKRGTQNK